MFFAWGVFARKIYLIQYKANISPGFFYILIYFIFAFTIQNVCIIVLYLYRTIYVHHHRSYKILA